MYILRITSLTAQRDMSSLIRVLLRVPGLTSKQISMGLKVPPLEVLSVEQEQQAKIMKSTLEKFGAVCEIENTKLSGRRYSSARYNTPKPHKKEVRLPFWFVLFAISVVCYTAYNIYIAESSNDDSIIKQVTKQVTKTVKPPAPENTYTPPEEDIFGGYVSDDDTPKEEEPEENDNPMENKSKEDLKNDLVKNPYNVDAWKALSENLEKEGDAASARAAKESYEKALKAQLVMSSLAKTFGNGVRVKIEEDVVFYRTNQELSDAKFYENAANLRDSLNSRFPNKDLVIENFTSNGTQRITIKGENRK